MALFGKKVTKKSAAPARKSSKVAAVKSADASSNAQGRTSATGTLASGILTFMHVTEKTSALAAQNTYVFAVASSVNKLQIRDAVEKKFGVTVSRVAVLNTKEKELRRGKQIGWRPGFKKAMVTIKEGQTIEGQ